MSLLQPECAERNVAGTCLPTGKIEKDKCYKETSTKRVCVFTNGCPENRIDCARIKKFLSDNDHILTDDIQDADIIFFNACALTHATQEFSINIIQFIQAQKRPSAKLIVCGCLPKINKPRLREVFNGVTFEHEIEDLSDFIETETNPQDTHANHLESRAHVPTTHRLRIPDLKKLVNIKYIKEKLTEPYRNHLDQTINVFGPNSFCIKVSTGCPNKCAFCAVKISRGKLRSKSINQIVEEFEQGLARGYKEFALLGTDVGAYGRDHGNTLVDLLKEMIKIEGDYTIRLRNIQPKFLIGMLSELTEVLRSGKISYLSSAAESGNNRILKLMRRGYTIEQYKQAILVLKNEFPDLQIRTQILVGFPGETEEEFMDSLRLIDEINFDFVEVYPFQARPGTEAEGMDNHVPHKVIMRRYHKAYMKALFHMMKSNEQKASEQKSWLEFIKSRFISTKKCSVRPAGA